MFISIYTASSQPHIPLDRGATRHRWGRDLALSLSHTFFVPSAMVSSTAKRHARARACASSSSTSSSPNLTADRVALSASRRNIRLRYDGLGPAFRVTATAALDCEGDGQEGEEVGHVTGFWLPTGYVHFDEMRVPRTARGRSQGAFGTGLLLGCYALCRLREKGCETAELLAINDNREFKNPATMKSLQMPADAASVCVCVWIGHRFSNTHAFRPRPFWNPRRRVITADSLSSFACLSFSSSLRRRPRKNTLVDTTRSVPVRQARAVLRAHGL